MTDYVDPDRAAFAALAKSAIAGPVHMLNLLKFHDQAVYKDAKAVSGAAAYKAYGEASAPFFAAQGGKIIWRGAPRFGLIGPADEDWDLAFIAAYPSKDAFVAMVKDPGYQAVVFHRQAAVKTSRLYCFEAAENAEGAFA